MKISVTASLLLLLASIVGHAQNKIEELGVTGNYPEFIQFVDDVLFAVAGVETTDADDNPFNFTGVFRYKNDPGNWDAIHYNLRDLRLIIQWLRGSDHTAPLVISIQGKVYQFVDGSAPEWVERPALDLNKFSSNIYDFVDFYVWQEFYVVEYRKDGVYHAAITSADPEHFGWENVVDQKGELLVLDGRLFNWRGSLYVYGESDNTLKGPLSTMGQSNEVWSFAQTNMVWRKDGHEYAFNDSDPNGKYFFSPTYYHGDTGGEFVYTDDEDRKRFTLWMLDIETGMVGLAADYEFLDREASQYGDNSNDEDQWSWASVNGVPVVANAWVKSDQDTGSPDEPDYDDESHAVGSVKVLVPITQEWEEPEEDFIQQVGYILAVPHGNTVYFSTRYYWYHNKNDFILENQNAAKVQSYIVSGTAYSPQLGVGQMDTGDSSWVYYASVGWAYVAESSEGWYYLYELDDWVYPFDVSDPTSMYLWTNQEGVVWTNGVLFPWRYLYSLDQWAY